MLLLGLGNPEKKYRFTRHNIGFMVLDAFARRYAFPAFSLAQKSHSLVAQDFIEHQKIILAKPQTFMNNSGVAVKSLTKNYKLKTKNLVVVHDDIDLPLGRIKISVGSGSAGHKGVESIIEALGTKDFARLRIGIQPKVGKPEQVEEFVIQRFSKTESQGVRQIIQNACDALDTLLTKGVEKAINEYN